MCVFNDSATTENYTLSLYGTLPVGGRYERGYDDRRGSGRGNRPPGPPPEGGGPDFNFSSRTVAVLAGVLVVGIGIGSAVTSTTGGDQGNIASSQQLDMAVPDPEFCRQWGASAFVMDIEMYTTLNPSSSFVTQPTLQPGCVIRRENWSVLRKEGAITGLNEREVCFRRLAFGNGKVIIIRGS